MIQYSHCCLPFSLQAVTCMSMGRTPAYVLAMPSVRLYTQLLPRARPFFTFFHSPIALPQLIPFHSTYLLSTEKLSSSFMPSPAAAPKPVLDQHRTLCSLLPTGALEMEEEGWAMAKPSTLKVGLSFRDLTAQGRYCQGKI